ncbi:MAG: DUF6285 domain-containing protein [Immundisolibacter sp.]|uniref:DUF6285 domain-containing protein n=1 Tax=Immundisolibacter sp. TaxID=1934948 RepID=UPI003EE364D6
MQDRPDAQELLEAVREFISGELLPVIGDPRLRFRSLVASNLLQMLQRELALESALLRDEWQRLAVLLGRADAPPYDAIELTEGLRAGNETLCALIRAGEAPPGSLAEVTQAVRAKLEVANPRYLAAFDPV